MISGGDFGLDLGIFFVERFDTWRRRFRVRVTRHENSIGDITKRWMVWSSFFILVRSLRLGYLI